MASLDGFINGPEQAKRLEEILRLENDLDALFSEKMKKLHQDQSTGKDSDGEQETKVVPLQKYDIDEKIELKKKMYDFKKTCWEMENARLNRSLAEFAALFSAGTFLIPYWTYNFSAIVKNDPTIIPWVFVVLGILLVGVGWWYVSSLPERYRSAANQTASEDN